MGNLFAKLFSLIGGFGATMSSTACLAFILDEPETPKSIIEK